jgi:hypothetical protein
MRPLNQSHQRAAPKKFSRMQASLSKFFGTRVLSSLTLLQFNSIVNDALTVPYSTAGEVRISIFYHAARIYN